MKEFPETRPKRRTINNILSYSLRKKAFMFFDFGDKPDIVEIWVDLSPDTIARYYRSWRKMPRRYNTFYLYLRELMRKMNKREVEALHQALADELGCDLREIKAHICRPWAIKQLITGEWLEWEVTKSAGGTRLVPGLKRTAQSMTRTKLVKHALGLIPKARPE
jgi:hypothetical protein